MEKGWLVVVGGGVVGGSEGEGWCDRVGVGEGLG